MYPLYLYITWIYFWKKKQLWKLLTLKLKLYGKLYKDNLYQQLHILYEITNVTNNSVYAFVFFKKKNLIVLLKLKQSAVIRHPCGALRVKSWDQLWYPCFRETLASLRWSLDVYMDDSCQELWGHIFGLMCCLKQKDRRWKKCRLLCSLNLTIILIKWIIIYFG